MSILKFQLHDWDVDADEPKEPISVEFAYDPEMSLEEQGFKKVSIYAGDDVSGGSVFLPLIMLNHGMTALMLAAAKRDNKGGIIIPNNKIIMPN